MSFSDTRHRFSDSMHNVSDSSKEMIGEHPVSTTFAAFGLGLGAGVGLVYLLAECSEGRREAGIAYRLGREVLDAVSSAVPESLSKLHN